MQIFKKKRNHLLFLFLGLDCLNNNTTFFTPGGIRLFESQSSWITITLVAFMFLSGLLLTLAKGCSNKRMIILFIHHYEFANLSVFRFGFCFNQGIGAGAAGAGCFQL